jgi:hypothetical protein
MLDGSHAGESGHVHTLLEWLDPGQGCRLLGQQPVRQEFVVVQCSPLLDQTRCGLGTLPLIVAPSSIRISASCSA